MASKKELRALITLAGKVDPSLTTALMKASGQNAKLTKNLKNANKQFRRGTRYGSKFGDMLKASFIGNTAANAVSKLASEITSLTGQALNMSSSLVEVQNVVDTTFGDNSKDIDKWSKTVMKSFGLTELQAKQWSGSMGAMLKSSNVAADDMQIMSKRLVELAGDMSSYYNLDHDIAWQKIRSGIAGENEPLKELGINMNVANLEAFALSRGITKNYKDMSQAEQTLLRYNYLMAQTTDAQGDYSKTLDTSWENQKRLLKNNFLQKLSSSLAKFTPQLTELTKKANLFVDKIDFDQVLDSVETGFKFLGSSVKFVADNFDILLPLVAGGLTIMAGFKILHTVQALMLAWRATTFAQTMAQQGLNAALSANPIGFVIVAIGLLVAAGIYLWRNWDKISQWIIGAWQNNVLPFFQGVGEWFSNLWTGLVDGFKIAWSGITEWFSGLWNGIVNLFKGYVNIYIKIFNFVIGALNKVNFKVPDWVPLIGGKEVGIHIPKLKEFAYGGIATQASIFGEAGPEMAIPLKRTSRSIGLLNQTARLLGIGNSNKSTGNTININIYGGDTEEVKRTVVGVIKEYFDDKERVSFA
ncbi:MAG: hypothetical protein FH761_17890 [Firmicutes bacterium]|nr:hypothetical protein [Bacillota bacterium]